MYEENDATYMHSVGYRSRVRRVVTGPRSIGAGGGDETWVWDAVEDRRGGGTLHQLSCVIGVTRPLLRLRGST